MTLTSPIRTPRRGAALLALLVVVPAIAAIQFAGAQDVPKGDTVAIKVRLHEEEHWIQIRLDEDSAPRHCANFKILAEGNFYAGMAFHRVIRDYLVQTGDPLTKDENEKRNWGTGGVGYDLAPEIGLPHKIGSIGMARLRSSNPNKRSSGSQFYIMLTDAPELDKDYTVFGQVTEGIQILGRMGRTRADTNDTPVERIEIVETRIGEPGLLNAIPNPIGAIPKVSMPELSMPKAPKLRNPFAKKDALVEDPNEPDQTEEFERARAEFLKKSKSKPAPAPAPAPKQETEVASAPEEEKAKRRGFLPRFGKPKPGDNEAPPPPEKDEAPAKEKKPGPLGRLVKKIW